MQRQKPYRKTCTQWLWGNWEGLFGAELRQKLLERMASSVEGQEKFWAYVKKGSPDLCWNWQGVLDHRGYGKFCFTPKINFRRKMFSHRISYFLKHRNLPEDLMVCHHCDNSKCANPDHLFLGTRVDNNLDKLIKGRQCKGEQIGVSKLTPAQVTAIRELHFYQGINCAEISRRFGVTPTNIHSIVDGRTWVHLPFDLLADPAY